MSVQEEPVRGATGFRGKGQGEVAKPSQFSHPWHGCLQAIYLVSGEGTTNLS